MWNLKHKKGKRSCWEIWFVEWRSWHIIRSLTDHRCRALNAALWPASLLPRSRPKEQKNVSATHESFFARWQLTFLTMEQILGFSAGQCWPSYLKVESFSCCWKIDWPKNFLWPGMFLSVDHFQQKTCDWVCKPFLIWSFWGSYFGEFYFDTWNYCLGWAIFYVQTQIRWNFFSFYFSDRRLIKDRFW